MFVFFSIIVYQNLQSRKFSYQKILIDDVLEYPPFLGKLKFSIHLLPKLIK